LADILAVSKLPVSMRLRRCVFVPDAKERMADDVVAHGRDVAAAYHGKGT